MDESRLLVQLLHHLLSIFLNFLPPLFFTNAVSLRSAPLALLAALAITYWPYRGAFQTHTFAAHLVPFSTGQPACSLMSSSEPSGFWE